MVTKLFINNQFMLRCIFKRIPNKTSLNYGKIFIHLFSRAYLFKIITKQP